MGFAYLESPGIWDDFKDNDDDGLTDEKRDNEATQIIGPTDGITDLSKFLDTYRMKFEDLADHWDADEDQDWQNGIDLNNNGRYSMEIAPGIWVSEPGEESGDDVGLDGVGPTELNYNGPDEGEGNGKPDYRQGAGCEPNFNATDVTESDMVGLTSFRLFPIPPHTPPYTRWFQNDKSMWELIGKDSTLDYDLGNISNLVECFASGPFTLFRGSEERISMAELHSYDALAGLNSDIHAAPALYEAKRIVQVIYEKDYRFAQPPKMPTLYATPADGKVILTWDNVSDTKTRDPFLGNINDFEGYKIFRASDKYMSDAEVITDGFGDPKLKKPIFQVDKHDSIFGFTDFGLVNGAAYNLGYDTGLTHHFIDNTIQNGRTYYYAIVAYDFGAASAGSHLAGSIPVIDPGISPSENNVVIELDEAEEVRSIGKNVAIVTPHQMAAGYIPPSVETNDGVNADVIGSGFMEPEILSGGALKAGHEYSVTFDIDTIFSVLNYDHGLLYTNSGLTVWDKTENFTPVYVEKPDQFAYNNLSYDDTLKVWHLQSGQEFSTDVFDGLRLNMFLPVKTAQFNRRNSGWVVGNAPIRITQTSVESQYFPWDYEIIFTNNDSAYVSVVKLKTMKDENNQTIKSNKLFTLQAFNFYVINKSFTDSTGAYERLDLVGQDMNNNAKFDLLGDRILVGPVTTASRWAGTAFIIDFLNAPDSTALPKPDDVYRLSYDRPFWSTDTLSFSVQGEAGLDREELKLTMDDIKVVPNPYVATNEMEAGVSNPYLNQRRRIMFTHLPAQCTIKIYTSSGILVNELSVHNSADNGIAHWDLLTKEGLEIAAGIYIYYVKSTATGDEKLGKFAVVK